MAKYSKAAQKAISAKMHKMKGEDRPQAQKVAIAMSEAREKGLKVPKKKSNDGKAGRPDIHCADHSYMACSDRRGANLKMATRKVELQEGETEIESEKEV